MLLLAEPAGLPFLPGIPEAFLRCCSAYCSNADWEGSFKVRKPSTELAFFFLVPLESLDEDEVSEARLDDAKLRASKDWRSRMEEELEAEVMEVSGLRWKLSRLEGRVSAVVEDLHDDESEVWSAGSGFL